MSFPGTRDYEERVCEFIVRVVSLTDKFSAGSSCCSPAFNRWYRISRGSYCDCLRLGNHLIVREYESQSSTGSVRLMTIQLCRNHCASSDALFIRHLKVTPVFQGVLELVLGFLPMC